MTPSGSKTDSGAGPEARGALRFLGRPVPLRIALILLLLGALVPSLVFFALEYRVEIADKRREIERLGRAQAQTIADDIAREIAIKRAQLTALAASPDLRGGNIAGLYRQAEEAAQSAPGWISLFTSDGRQLFNTLEPLGAALHATRNPDVLRAVQASGFCQTTDLFQSPRAEGFVVSLFCPAQGAPYVLAGALPVEHLNDAMRRQTPEGWLAVLADRKGRVIARSDGAARAIGLPVGTWGYERIAAAPKGWLVLPLDGVESFAGWRQLADGWTVLAAVPRATVEGPLRRWRDEVLMSLLTFSGLAFISAALVGEWVLRSMRQLSKAAAQIVAGGAGEPVKSSIREVNEVGRALAQAARDRAKGEVANAHLAALVASSGDAITSFSLDGEILTWNAAAESLYGWRADEAIGRNIADLLAPDRRSEIDQEIAAARAGGSLRLETVRRRKDGGRVEVSLDAGPVRNAEGQLVGISTIAHDISARKRNEAHMEFVMRELSHRTKNLITVIIAMARRTARQSGDFSDFETKFAGRLHGLARSHDLLVHTDWTGAPIEQLVRSQLAPFVADPGSLQVSGPDLFLRPEAVQNLGFALHELATNANKFGALSQPGGQVTISWGAAINAAGAARIRFVWRESGGPEVAQPTRAGFGSTVIQKLTEASLNATVTTSFEREGFRWEVDMPANEILSDGDAAVAGLLAGDAPLRAAG